MSAWNSSFNEAAAGTSCLAAPGRISRAESVTSIVAWPTLSLLAVRGTLLQMTGKMCQIRQATIFVMFSARLILPGEARHYIPAAALLKNLYVYFS